MQSAVDLINPEEVQTLSGLFAERVRRSADLIAYQHYDAGRQKWLGTSWVEMAAEVSCWQLMLQRAGLQAGDKVAVMLPNSREWILFDQAALGLGLVTVPIYLEDRAENAAYILKDAEVKFLLLKGKKQWNELLSTPTGLPTVKHIVSTHPIDIEDNVPDDRLSYLQDWLFGLQAGAIQQLATDPDALASIIYTSGTTGNPKGVMLSHRNMLMNAWCGQASVQLANNEVLLSFLPLSHTLERTIGYYLPMMIGATVAFNRAINLLANDLTVIRPTVLISVPRIYERVHGRIMDNLQKESILRRQLMALTEKIGWRNFQYQQKQRRWSPLLLLWPLLNRLVAQKVSNALGGRLKVAICGGAALPGHIGQFFVSLGVNLLQGYGLTEASPVITVNRPEQNRPSSIGLPLPGIAVRLGESGELQTQSACVMQGYWRNDAATQAAFTEDNWLRTGDLARCDADGFYYITGRLKDILVLSNGEKMPPGDMEAAILRDPLFEQVMILGEGRPCLTALVVLNDTAWPDFIRDFAVDANDLTALERADVKRRLLQRMAKLLDKFPGYAQVKSAYFTLEPWTVENGLLTPTLKIKRMELLQRYADAIESMYANR